MSVALTLAVTPGWNWSASGIGRSFRHSANRGSCATGGNGRSVMGAVGFGTGVRSGCHCWQPKSEIAAHLPNIGYDVDHCFAVARIFVSVGPGFSSLQLIARFESMMFV